METSPRIILSSDLQSLTESNYTIPIYQRPYCWDKDNIMRLLNDIEGARGKKPAAPYYIGNVIISAPLNNDGKITESAHNFDILDGQQRFTTLTMIAAYLGLDKAIRTKDGQRLTLQMDQEESAAFELLLKEQLSNRSNLPMLPKAFQEAAEVIVNWFIGKEEIKDSFKDYLLDQVKFFEIDLSTLIEDADNKTIATINYYDNLNTSGKQLEPLDVLKGLLFAKLDKEDAIKAASIWNSAFNQEVSSTTIGEKTKLSSLLSTENSRGNEANKDPQLTKKRFRLVKDWELVSLAHYSIVGSENGYFVPGQLQPRAIVDSYNLESHHEPKEIIERIKLIDNWLNIYFINSENIEEEADQDRYYLPAERGETKTEDEKIKNLSLLQFLLHSIYNGNPHTWLQPLINEMVKSPITEVSFAKILGILEHQQIEKLKILNTLTETGLPAIQYGEDGVRLYLTMVEYALAQKDPSQKVRRTIGRSVEHIYPQNFGEDETDANVVRMHTIYNLALLTANRNSGYSDKTFDEKRQFFNSDYNREYKESLRLAEYYSSDKNISATRKDFESIALAQHETLVAWANGHAQSTDQ
jgi:hypothetical protein